MPLLDLKTNLKSLKYGQDRPGGGSSGQPYVQYPLPDVASAPYLDFYENNKTTLDFPTRGGKLDLNIGQPYITLANRYDRERIQKFLKDAPRGTIFIDKQKALQISNPKIQVGSQVNPDLGTLPFNIVGALETTRIYNNGANTLAQVEVQGSGYHLNRHGLVPVDTYKQKYEYIVNDRIRGNVKENRLVLLHATKIETTGRIGLDNDSIDIGVLNDLGLSRSQELLLQYPGGPSSAAGLGLTTINRFYRSQQPVDRVLILPNAATPPSGSTVNIQNLYSGSFTDSSSPTVLYKYEVSPFAAYAYSGSNTVVTIRRATDTNINAARTRLSYAPATTGSLTNQGVVGTLYTNTGPSILNLYDAVLTAQAGNNVTQLYKYSVDQSAVYAYKNQSEVIINRTTTTDKNIIEGTEVGTNNIRNFNYTFNYNLLKNSLNQNRIGQHEIIQDFRERASTEPQQGNRPNQLAATTGYTSLNNIAKKYGVGNPGSKNLKRVSYNESVNLNGTPTDETQDLINMLDVGYTVTSTNPGLKDLINFTFHTVEINKQDVPIVFRAFLTGLQDNHSADYAPFRYTGRGENFYTYNGFNREISFNFKIAAQSRSEMRPLYRKLNFLLSQLYPDYKAGTGFMRAPMIRLTIGDYIYYQPGFLKSINITVPDDAPWEIANNQIPGADADMYQLPQMVDVACNFTPIHNFLPRRAVDIDKIPPFITPNDPGGNKFGISDLN